MTRAQAQRIAVASLVALIGLSGTTALGFWQYTRAHRDDISARVIAAPAKPLRALVRPAQYVPEAAFAHRVSLRGRLSTTDALLSCSRHERTNDDCWIVAPVRLSPELASTAVIGFTSRADATATLQRLRAARIPLEVWQGRLQPGELIDRGRALLPPSESIASLNINELALRWRTNLLDGYVVLSTPVVLDGLDQAFTSALILPPSGITWRNLFYAWQWWAFAAFVLFLLARYIIDVRAEAPTLPPITAEPGTQEDQP